MTGTTVVDIANRALSDMGARCTLTAIDDTTPQGKAVGIWINTTRRELLRAAPWLWARKTKQLVSLGVFTDVPNIVPPPWNAMYTYPADAIKINYLLPPPPTVDVNVPIVGSPSSLWCGPSRTNRFVPSYYDGGMTPATVLLANLLNAYAVYVVDVTDPNLMDVGFKDAWVALLSARLILPLSGNVQLKAGFQQTAKNTVLEARAQSANESISSSDHTPDWIQARGVPSYNYGNQLNLQGQWYSGWDNFDWSM